MGQRNGLRARAARAPRAHVIAARFGRALTAMVLALGFLAVGMPATPAAAVQATGGTARFPSIEWFSWGADGATIPNGRHHPHRELHARRPGLQHHLHDSATSTGPSAPAPAATSSPTGRAPGRVTASTRCTTSVASTRRTRWWSACRTTPRATPSRSTSAARRRWQATTSRWPASSWRTRRPPAVPSTSARRSRPSPPGASSTASAAPTATSTPTPGAPSSARPTGSSCTARSTTPVRTATADVRPGPSSVAFMDGVVVGDQRHHRRQRQERDRPRRRVQHRLR